jgi:small-conductance mechanosensitive channel
MQGIDEFGESGLMLRMKIMTRPGEQFPIRRRALSLIKKAFDENGIKLAVPMVQVSGDAVSKSAAASQLRRKRKQQAVVEASS